MCFFPTPTTRSWSFSLGPQSQIPVAANWKCTQSIHQCITCLLVGYHLFLVIPKPPISWNCICNSPCTEWFTPYILHQNLIDEIHVRTWSICFATCPKFLVYLVASVGFVFKSSQCCYFGCGASMAPSLEGVAEEWEASQELRDFVRVKGCLFAPAARSDDIQITVECGARNYHTLKPLAKRLKEENGSVGQIHIPSIKKETFCCKCINVFGFGCMQSSLFCCYFIPFHCGSDSILCPSQLNCQGW